MMINQHSLHSFLAAIIIAAAASTVPALAQSPSAPRASNTVADWPLTFDRHNFSALCYDTQTCSIVYDNFQHGTDKPTPPAASLPPDLRDRVLQGSYLAVPLNRPPAKIDWRSRDGTGLSATINFADVFKDRLVRHKLARDEIPEGISIGSTSIILEVDDRTINVYTRTMIPTKREQTPGNRYSDFRNDLFRVFSRTY